MAIKFDKGEIIEYAFPKKKDSGVICDMHRAVVLYARSTPYNTTTIAPITSATGLKKSKTIPENYIELNKNNYPMILTHDSYINLDMMITVDTKELIKFSRGVISVKQKLTVEDINRLDYGIALSYELQSYLNKQISDEYENIIEYIDTEVREKINKVMDMIQDPDVQWLLKEILDKDLLSVLRAERATLK